MKFIKFVLSAPLQSWGEDARWDQRTTAAFPTKSAIIGLIGCCMGLPRGDERLNHLNDSLHIAVRADRAGQILTDFHTVQGTNGIFLNAEGKPRGGGSTIITPKQYLQDARFTVFIWGAEDALAQCYFAMLHPKWAVYLGRKSCVPSVPVYPHWAEAPTPLEAVRSFTQEEQTHSSGVVQVEMDALPNEKLSANERLITRRDNVIRSDRNEYDLRWVRAFTVRPGGERKCI